MRYGYAVTQMRAAEQRLMQTVPEGTLMQRAASGLARRCAALLGTVYGSRVLLLVGAGNNGGDALFAGARLARRGARVTAVLLDPDRAHRGGLAALLAAGGRTVTEQDPEEPDLVVDGIVGLGGSPGLRPVAGDLVARLPAAATKVAVDVPSGLDATTGERGEQVFAADVTVTFGAYKCGLFVGAGPAVAGVVELVDIGLEAYLTDPALSVADAADVAGWLPVPGPEDDKYRRGVVGVASGSLAYGGAAVLSVGGAVRGGAGMVRYAGAAAPAVRSAWPEAVVSEGRPGQAGRVQAWAVGPGLGTDERAAEVVREVLVTDLPVLVDADGLTVLAGHLDWVRDRRAPTVLTPHDGEFARLFGEVGADRLAAAGRAVAASGATVLLKGNATIVGSPGRLPAANPTGTAWLGTAGSGDVLSGLIGALLAGDLGGYEAAVAGAFLHGLAGRRASAGGPISAVDELDALPGAFRTVLAPGS